MTSSQVSGSLPSVDLPDVEIPDVKIPKVKTPKIDTEKLKDQIRELDVQRIKEILVARGDSGRDKGVQAAKFFGALIVSCLALSRMKNPGFGSYVILSGSAIVQSLDWRGVGGGLLGRTGVFGDGKSKKNSQVEKAGLQPVVRGAQTAATVYALGLLVHLIGAREGLASTLSKGIGYTFTGAFGAWWVLDVGNGYKDLQTFLNQPGKSN